MEKSCNNKYLGIPKKIDLEGKSISIRSRYTFFPLYDVEKNSYIRRYRLWAKYRDKCIEENRAYVDCKQYSKILMAMATEIRKQLLIDPDGVSFTHFKLKVLIKRRREAVLILKHLSKKKGNFKPKNWSIRTNRTLKEQIEKAYKENKLSSFSRFAWERRNIATKFDIFDDF